MCEIWLGQLNSETPIKRFQGKASKVCSIKKFNSVLAVILFLDFAFGVVCDEVAMVSVPLGFEISGFDRTKTWVSQNGVFAFGFMEISSKDGDEFDGYVVGVRYNIGNKAANMPIWTVGGNLRVSENSTVRLNVDGRLILFDNPSGLIVWSSNTSHLGVEKATLLDNGNLVLMGNKDNELWESFNSPTSTLLPSQSFHFPQTLRAPSTKSISSYYSFVIHRSGELALVWENNVTYWNAHLTSTGGSGIVKEAILDSNGVFRVIAATSDRTVWSVSSKDFADPSVVLRHIRIDPDGNLRIYSWDRRAHVWRIGWQAVENNCHVFGSCGLYSLCGYNSTAPVCDCLYRDISINWRNGFTATDLGISGCRKMVDLASCKMNTSMMTLKRTVLYGLYPPLDIDLMLSEDACKEYCSNDSTCIAVTSKNDGSGICTIKRTSFISGYRDLSVPSTSYLKVCLVPQAVSAQGVNPHGNNANPISIPSKAFINRGGEGKTFLGAIALIAFGTLLVFLSIEMFIFGFIYRRWRVNSQRRIPFEKDTQMNPHYSVLIRLSYLEVIELTANFSSQLGPFTYKGLLPNKLPIVAKVLDRVSNEKEFRMAVSTLGVMHHRNLVSVKGFCFEPQHAILLYEYVANDSLYNWLFNGDNRQNDGNLQQRLDIALGVARALAYLHSECQTSVAHGNLTLENVLLDENLVPKVTEFGIRSLLVKEAASSSSESLVERDILMFGKILLQILMRKQDIDAVEVNLDILINEINGEAKAEGSEEEVDAVGRSVKIAFWCMQNQPFLRPSIGEVVKVLEGTFSVDRPPLKSGSLRQQDEVVVDAVLT